MKFAVIGLALLAAGCSTSGYELGDIAPLTTQSTSSVSETKTIVKTAYPRFGDRDPHDWESVTPWHYPIHGTDVSKYQNDIDWSHARQNGVSFAFIKATEGGDHVDARFMDNWRSARTAGIPRGAYHFYYFCRPAAEQARWFIQNVPKDASSLPPVLDMEWNPKSPTCKLRPDAAKVRSEMQIFLRKIERHYGKTPIIYTTLDFYRDNNLDKISHYPFWLRSTAGHPDERFGDQRWLFWQYTGTGIVPGVDGDADLNVFNGSRDDWQSWLGKAAS
jgi:lysozyme